MIVLKFGGTSVANAQNIQKIKEIVLQKETHFICVVSALGSVTNQLQDLAYESLNQFPEKSFIELKEKHYTTVKELMNPTTAEKVIAELNTHFQELENLCIGVATLSELSDRTLARFLSFGEKCSALIVRSFLNQDIPTEMFPSQRLLTGSGNYLECDLNFEQTEKNIKSFVSESKNYVAPGFIASNQDNETVLLGRGGSDYTATVIGSSLNVEKIEIWSDVNGMLNADPTIVSQVKTIQQLSYEEALELSHFGAKVLHSKSVKPARKKEIPIYLKNTFQPENQGTLITKNTLDDGTVVKGISSLSQISLISFFGTSRLGGKKLLARLFSALDGVPFILITQSSSEQDICLGIRSLHKSKAVEKINSEFEFELNRNEIEPIKTQDNLAIVALVGDQMKQKYGMSGLAFSALGENGVNVVAIAQGATERNISAIVEEKDIHKAINVLHEKFFLDSTKKIHLFVAGMGNVGIEFLNILKERKKTLLNQYNTDLKLVGLVNSKCYLIDEKGIELDDIGQLRTQMQTWEQLEEFQQKAAALNLRNSIFVDNTAAKEVSDLYEGFLSKNISVVACNKIASSDALTRYQKLKSTAKDKNVQFRYETCVGAALPIIKTIQHLVLSGDEVYKIQAVLSGSLNYIFNHYKGQKTFAEIVKDAQEEGYTEPNPLIDLSGVDVMRKILILARESGSKMEMSDIENINFLPESCLNTGSVDELFSELEQNESHFKSLYEKANEKNHRLKVVATYEKGKAFVSLEEIAPESPIYHLEGKDNIVSINTYRYPEEPMVIKGAGAGASVTASGVFSDVMLTINK